MFNLTLSEEKSAAVLTKAVTVLKALRMELADVDSNFGGSDLCDRADRAAEASEKCEFALLSLLEGVVGAEEAMDIEADILADLQ